MGPQTALCVPGMVRCSECPGWHSACPGQYGALSARDGALHARDGALHAQNGALRIPLGSPEHLARWSAVSIRLNLLVPVPLQGQAAQRHTVVSASLSGGQVFLSPQWTAAHLAAPPLGCPPL